MVNLGLRRRQQYNLRENLEKIKQSSNRFAVVGPDSISYYSDRESLYEACPSFKPGRPLSFGTKPILFDIGKANNSLEYQREQLEKEKEKLHEDAKSNLIKVLDLSRRERELKAIESS